MKYSSAELLNELFAQTEMNIVKAVADWQQLPDSCFLETPAPGQWNAAQCLEHLNSYGRYYLPAMEKAITLSDKKASPYFTSGWLGGYFYRTMQTGANGRPEKKLRSPRNHVPVPRLNPVTVLSEFISQQETLEALLEKAKSVDINKAKVPVSIAPFIKMKLGDAFLFYVAHINRHIQQAQRALNTSCSILPKSPWAKTA